MNDVLTIVILVVWAFWVVQLVWIARQVYLIKKGKKS